MHFGKSRDKDTYIRYHKQFIHGISSLDGNPFSHPVDTRLVWQQEAVAGKVTVLLVSEGYCSVCNEWLPLARNKKRHAWTTTTVEKALSDLRALPEDVISSEPLKVIARVSPTTGNLEKVPKDMVLTAEMVQELINEPLNISWYRHAFKCHPANST